MKNKNTNSEQFRCEQTDYHFLGLEPSCSILTRLGCGTRNWCVRGKRHL